MKPSFLALALGAFTLSGCLEPDQTSSGFKTPTSSGSLSGNGGSQVRSGDEFSDLTGNGFAYQAGAIKSAGFQANAGLVPGASVTELPATGSATMSGVFEVAVVTSIYAGGSQLNGQSFVDRGSVSLTADFDRGTLTGGGNGLDGGLTNFYLKENSLSVDGTFTGQELKGTVSYDGVSGPLRGLIGGDEVIGAFHGNSDNQVHAGGFIAN